MSQLRRGFLDGSTACRLRLLTGVQGRIVLALLPRPVRLWACSCATVLQPITAPSDPSAPWGYVRDPRALGGRARSVTLVIRTPPRQSIRPLSCCQIHFCWFPNLCFHIYLDTFLPHLTSSPPHYHKVHANNPQAAYKRLTMCISLCEQLVLVLRGSQGACEQTARYMRTNCNV